MKFAVLAVVYGAVRQEEPEEALHPGASLLEEAGVPARLLGTASAYALPGGLTRRPAGRTAPVAMQVPDSVPQSYAFKGKDPSQLPEIQLSDLIPGDGELVEWAPEPGQGPGLLQGLFGVRSEARRALRLKDEMPKEARETTHGRLVHWALLEATQHNPHFEGKTLLALREMAPDIERVVKFDAAHAGDIARMSPLVNSRMRLRMRDFTRRFVEPGPWPPSAGAAQGDLQWADEKAQALVSAWGYSPLRADTVLGPFIQEAETLAKSALRSDENPHGLLRTAANFGLLLKDGEEGMLAEVVVAEALECMKVEYSQPFAEAAVQMYQRFQTDFAKNLAIYYGRGVKQELAATKKDLESMPNRERRDLVLKGMAAGALLYGLLPNDVNALLWGKPTAEPTAASGPAKSPSAGAPASSADQELKAMQDAAIRSGLYGR